NILERAPDSQISKMKNCDDPNNYERQNNRRTRVENAVEILAKRHCGECNGRGKSDRSGDETGHEPERWMIDFREKMVFSARRRQCSRGVTITECAAKRGNSTDDPEHQQREP